MSKTIDERIVSMQFDNKQFEANASASLSTLEKLKKSLGFEGASKGLETVSTAMRGIDTVSLGNGVDAVKAKFSALQVVAVTTLANLTNSAVNAGKRLVSAFTVDPVKTGLQEYETQINAIQTILSNTKSKGSTLEDVNNALDELNKYADLTIYNFTEMTRNIGTFTAAGIGLEDSTKAIQGIANLAAMSGSNAQQASTAMYQLSQALSSGTVKLQDWNSVVNAGMGGQLFQDALKKTARSHGIAVDEMIKKNGSFRESLQEGWISADILTETLSKMTQTGAAEYLSDLTGISEDQIRATQKLVDQNNLGAKGYEELAESMAKTGKISKKEAIDILDMADEATNAATKVKTFTQLMDTLKEAAQSGWTQTWEILIGDFEEARDLFTSISDTVSDFIGKTSDARNNLLQGWKDLGGRETLLKSFKNILQGLGNLLEPIAKAFSNIFDAIKPKELLNATNAFEKLSESFKAFTAKLAPGIEKAFTGIFAVLKVFTTIAKAIIKVIFSLATNLSGVISVVVGAAGSIGEAFSSMYKAAAGDGGIFQAMANGAAALASTLKAKLEPVINGIKSVFSWIAENISFTDILQGAAAGGIFLFVKKLLGSLHQLQGLTDDFKKSFSGLVEKFGDKGIVGILFGTNADNDKNSISEVLDSVKTALTGFTQGLKVASIVAIAAAVGTLTASLKILSEISAEKIAVGLLAIKVMLMSLTTSFNVLTETLSTFKGGRVIRAGVALMAMAEAVNILASAMTKLAKLSWNGIVKGIVSVAASMKILTVALGSMGGKVSLKSAATMIILAETCKKIAAPLEAIGKMSWGEISRGLAGMGGALLEMTGIVTALSYVSKTGKSLAGGVAIALIAASLDKIAGAMLKFCEMSWGEIKRSLVAMGGALIELGAITTLVGKIGKGWAVLGAVSIDVITLALNPIANAMKKFGSMTWGEIARGLVAMGGAITELGAITTAVGMVGQGWALLGAVSIDIISLGLGKIADALQKFGSMSWGEIARGVVAMGAALTELAAMNLVNTFGMLGALSYDVVSLGLGKIADAFKKFGEMSWGEITRGLIGMGGALKELAVMNLANTFGELGAIAYDTVSSGLIQIAEAFKTFGSMSWDEVKNGLVAMGSALSEIAIGDILNTFGKFGAESIKVIAEPLGVLADSVKKWSNVTVPGSLGTSLKSLSTGIRNFNFSGFAAGAMAEAAPAIGKMAVAVSKWENVVVPRSVTDGMAMIAAGINQFSVIGAAKLKAIASPLSGVAKAMSSFSKIEGDASNIKALSDNVTDVANKVSGINVFSIRTASSGIETLAKALTKASKTDVSGVGKFVNAANRLNDIDVGDVNVSGVSSAVNKVSGAMKKMNSTISKSGSSIASSMESAISSAAKSIDTSSFTKAGSSAVSALAKGITSKRSTVIAAVKSVISSAASSARAYASSFQSVGSALGEGIKVGLNQQRNSIISTASSIARAAADAAKRGAKVNSPSKLTIPVGSGIGEGLVVGMQRVGSLVTKTGEELGYKAANCLTGVMQTVDDLLNGDMDTNPTITPVLDLSDVQNGIGVMDGMFGSSYAMSTVGSISRSMSGRNSNDVYSAITDLKNVLAGKTGDTYNINGVTYDDGDNIRGAVESIVRAAKIERRA